MPTFKTSPVLSPKRTTSAVYVYITVRGYSAFQVPTLWNFRIKKGLSLPELSFESLDTIFYLKTDVINPITEEQKVWTLHC